MFPMGRNETTLRAMSDVDDLVEILVRQTRLLGDARARRGADDDAPLLQLSHERVAADETLGLGP
jgi:hypothetical protein